MKQDELVIALGPFEGLNLLKPTGLVVHAECFVKVRPLLPDEAITPNTDVIIMDTRVINHSIASNPPGYVLVSNQIQGVSYRRSVDVPGVLLCHMRIAGVENVVTQYLFGTVEAIGKSMKLADDLGLLEGQA